MTHSHPASGTGLLQLNLFEEEGVNPKNILIGHCGDSDSIDYLLKVLDRGAFIGMDRYGSNRVMGAERRNATVVELVKRGYVEQMFLSQDYCCNFDWFEPEYMEKMFPKWSYTYILDEIIPDLEKQGVTKEHIQTMMHENPRRWFDTK